MSNRNKPPHMWWKLIKDDVETNPRCYVTEKGLRNLTDAYIHNQGGLDEYIPDLVMEILRLRYQCNQQYVQLLDSE